MPNGEDPYLQNVHKALTSKVDGFNKTYDEFVSSMSDPAYVQNVYNALTQKIDGFNKTYDEFYSATGLKKKEPSVPATEGGGQPSAPGSGITPGTETTDAPTPQTAVPGSVQGDPEAQQAFQGLQNILQETGGKGFTGQVAQPQQLSGPQAGAATGQRPATLGGLFSPNIERGVETFGQQTEEGFIPTIATEDQIQFAEDQISELEKQKQLELKAIEDQYDPRYHSEENYQAQIEEITNQYDKLIKAENNKIGSLELIKEQGPAKQLADFKPEEKTEEEKRREAEEYLEEQNEFFNPVDDETGLVVPVSFKMVDLGLKRLEEAKPEAIKRYSNLVDKDIDQWAETTGEEVSVSDVEDIKLFQEFTKSILDDDELTEDEKLIKLSREYQRLNAKIELSNRDKELRYLAAVKDKDVSDIIYDEKQQIVDDGIIENLPSDMAEFTQEIWDQTSEMREFMSQYYDPTGRKGFTVRDGEVVVSGITDPKKLEYITGKANQYVSNYEKMIRDRYAQYEDDLQPKRQMAKNLNEKINDANRVLNGLDENDPRRRELQIRIDDAKRDYDKINAEILEADKWKSAVFLTEPKNLLDGISNELSESESAQAAFSSQVEGLSPYQQFERAYLKLKDDTERMREEGDFDASVLDQIGQNVRSWLDLGMLSLSDKEKEYLANRRILNSLTPIFLNNNTGVTETDADFFEGFMSGASSFLTPEVGDSYATQTKTVADQLSFIQEFGFASDDFNDKEITEKMQERIEDIPWYSSESTGEMVGVVGAVITDLAISNAVVTNPALSLARKNDAFKVLAKTYDNAMDATKIGRFMKAPIEQGIRFEVAGQVFGSAEEELNFESGLIGMIGGEAVNKIFSKIPRDKLVGWTYNFFGGHADDAINTFKKIGEATSRGAGEVAEEFNQELVQIYNDELRDRGFWEEVQARFGDFDDNMKFFVSSFMMGAGFSFIQSKEARASYDRMTDEQKEIVDKVKSEIGNDIAEASGKTAEQAHKIKVAEESINKVAETEGPTPISKAEIIEDAEAETEYKVDDETFTEEEISTMLEDPNFVNRVENEEVKLTVTNPSEAIQEKINPKIEEDAVQEQVTTEIPIQPEAVSGEEVQETQPESELEEPVGEGEKAQEEVDIKKSSIDDLEKIQLKLEDSTKEEDRDLFNKIDKELESREWKSVINSPLNETNSILDDLIKKEKEMPNGFGSYIEMSDAKQSKAVVKKYSDEVSKEEAMKDFKDAFFGNPTSWYSDALKLRESTRAFIEKGGSFKELLSSVQQEFESDSFSEQDAASVINSKLNEIKRLSQEDTAKQKEQPSEQVALSFDEISEDVESITEGKTPVEIAEEANRADEAGDTVTEEEVEGPTVEDTENALKDAYEAVPEGQAAISNKSFFDSVADMTNIVFEQTGKRGDELIEDVASRIESITDGGVAKEDIIDASEELKGLIPKTRTVSGKSTTKVTKEKFDTVAKAIEDLADKLSSDMSTLKSSPLPIVQQVVAGALKVSAATVRATGNVAQAIDDGINHIKESDWYKGLSDNGKQAAEKMARASIQQKVDQTAKETVEEEVPAPEAEVTTEEEAEAEEETKEKPKKKKPKEKDRAFAERLAEDKSISEDIREGLSKDARKYIPISNEVTVNEANAIIEAKGNDQAMRDVLNMNNKMTPRVRVTIAMELIKKFNAEGAEDSFEKAVEVANELSQYATQLGQAVQIFSLWDRISVEGLILSYEKNQKKARKKLKDQQKSFYDASKKGYKVGTTKAAKKATQKVFGKDTPKTKRANAFNMSKSELAKKKKEALDRLKNAIKKGPGGLTAGGINVEALDALADYGFYLFADGVRSFREWAKEMRKATGVKDEDVLKQVWTKQKSETGKTLEELSKAASVEDIVADHFASSTDNAKLAEKLKDSFNLDDELASGLADELTAEFEKIVKNERKKEIKKRSVKETKKAKEAIEAISETDNMNDSDIEQKIEEAFGIKPLSEEQQKRIKELVDERDKRPEGFLRNEATREILSEFEKANGMSKGDIFWSMWYASVLSGYETQMLNVGANALNIALESIVTLFEESIAKGDPKAFIDALTGMTKGARQGMAEFNQILAKGYSPEKVNIKMETKDALEAIDKDLAKNNPLRLYKFVGRFMSAVDTGSFMAAKGMRKNQLARQIAREEGLRGDKLKNRVSEILNNDTEAYDSAVSQAEEELKEIEERTGKIGSKEKKRFVKIRANEIIEEQIDEEIVQKARDFAAFTTFNYDPEGVLGVFAMHLSAIGRKFPPFKLVVPFTRVVANVLNQQIDYTPYGFLRAYGTASNVPLIKHIPIINRLPLTGSEIGKLDRKTSSKTLEERNRKLIKAAIGTSLMVGFYLLTKSYEDDDDPYFAISGKGPSDFKKKNQLYSQGWKPYSIKIGDKWISYQYTNLGVGLSFIGNWVDNEKYKNLGEADLVTRSGFALQSSGSAIMDMSFLTGLSGLMSALTTTGSPEKTAEKLLKSGGQTLTSFIPNLFKQIDKAYDPTIYDTSTIKASILKEIPIVKRLSNLKPRLNAFGQPVEKKGNRFYSTVTDDQVWLFMAKHEVFAPGTSPDTKNIFGEIMTDEEFYDYYKTAGEIAYEMIMNNLESYESLFVDLDKKSKQKFINDIFRDAKETAKYLIVE